MISFLDRLRKSRSIFRKIDRNVYLFFQSAVLSSVSLGIFNVVFNLYVLSVGISESGLGIVVGAGPLATALVAIPVSLVAERLGYKRSLAIILTITGLTQFARVITREVPVMIVAAFIGGLGSAGEFVVRTPFLADNTAGFATTIAFSMNQVLTNVAMSIGNMLGGHLPNFTTLRQKGVTSAYRFTLVFASLLSLLAVAPILLMKDSSAQRRDKVDPAPYLWGIDKVTKQLALISLFRGLTVGFASPFLNVYFVTYLGAQREFFSAVMALAIIPIMVGVSLGPIVAKRLGHVRALTLIRSITPVPLIALAVTKNVFVAATAEWMFRGLSMMETPLSFSLSMQMGTKEMRPAIAAWLHVTFVLGNAIAAPVVGRFLARGDYGVMFALAAISIGAASLLNHVMFSKQSRDWEES